MMAQIIAFLPPFLIWFCRTSLLFYQKYVLCFPGEQSALGRETNGPDLMYDFDLICSPRILFSFFTALGALALSLTSD